MTFFFILYLSSILLTQSYIINENPILLFPGLGGSRLVKNNIDIWPPKLKYFLWNYKEWNKNMIINHDNNNIIYDSNVKTLHFGDKKSLDLHQNIPYIIKENFYDSLLNEYSDIHPIPYDFRLLHSHTYRNSFNSELEKYIETFNKPVVLLTHSCGGLLCHSFLLSKSDEWKHKHVKSVININVPFGGLLVTLQEMIMNTTINKVLGKKLIKSLGGIIINLPNIKYFDNILIVNGKIIQDYFDYFNLNDIKILYDNNKDFIDTFSKSNNVKTHIIYTSNITTPHHFDIIDKEIKIITSDGDGTVPLNSLLIPNSWNHNNIKFMNLPNFEHTTVLFSDKLKEIIKNIIQALS